MANWLRRVRRLNARNVEVFRHAPLAEISGSLGDLGTLLPLMIALAVQNSIKLGSTLVFSGLFNVLTGAAFGIPLPVQPMKVRSQSQEAIYAEAVTDGLVVSRLSLPPPSRDVKTRPWASSSVQANGSAQSSLS